MGGGCTIYFCYSSISQPRTRSHNTHCRNSWRVLLKVHIFQHLGTILSTAKSTVPRDPPCVSLCPPWNGAYVGNLLTHSTSSRSLQDLTGVRLSFISRLLQRSWLEWWWWRAWFRANKLLPDRARLLPPPGGGGCGAGRIPAEPRAAGGGGTTSLCAGTLTSPRWPRLRGQRGPRLRSGRTRCALCGLREAQGRALGDQTRILLRASPIRAWGPRRRSKRVTPRGTRASQLVRPGFRLSPGTASQPQRPQPGRIRSLLYAFTPSSVARVRSTRISIAYSSASQTHPENPPRTKVERASPRDLDVQTRATL